ncbi:polymorphic toxin-type HINT domain-containing protein [Spirillospora sp. CA-255316]
MLRRLGDGGEGSPSYLAAILLIASITAAVTAVALPDEVVANIRAGICTVAGGRDCVDRTGAGGTPSPSPSSSPSPSGPSGTTPGATPSGSPTGGETPEQREYREALDALARAEREAREVEGEWDEFDLLAEIGKLGLDFIAGDIIACVEEPSLGDCLWALVGLVPWGKIGKLLKSIPKVIKLIDRFLDLKRRLDKARKARKDARDRLDRAKEACERKNGPGNSFVPGTLVLMADGTRRPIERVRAGDLVWASDPEGGRSGPQPVTAVIGGTGVKRLVDLTIDLDGQVGGRTTTLTGTGGHPFWVPSTGDWIDAGDLVFGDRLSTADGRPATVVGARERARLQRVHNLSVAGPHTYHVVAAGRSVLVHNDPVPTPGASCGPDGPEPTPTPTPTPSKGQPDPASQAGDVDLVADKIAMHANQRSIPGVPEEEVAEYLEGIMRGSPGYKLRPTPSGTPRWAWWDSRTGTMVIREGDGGTFMQPDRGHQYFLDQISE